MNAHLRRLSVAAAPHPQAVVGWLSHVETRSQARLTTQRDGLACRDFIAMAAVGAAARLPIF